MITVSIFVRDLLEAYDFYCVKLPFKSINSREDIRNKPSNHFYVEGLDSGYELRMEIPNSGLLNDLLSKERHIVTFGEIDIAKFYLHAKQHLPETVDTETVAPGFMSGPHECPGGLFLNITDPSGNFLTFTAW